MNEPNITCRFCGYSYHASCRWVADLLCFRCQGWVDEKGQAIPAKEAEMTEVLMSFVDADFKMVRQ